MKKTLLPLLVMVLLLISSLGVMAQNDDGIQRMGGKIEVHLEGEELELEQAPYIKEGRTMIPLRDIMEALDAQVDYDAETQKVSITRGERLVELNIDSREAFINNEEMKLDAAPEIVSDRTFVPLRFVAEAFGAEAEWDGDQRRIDISGVIDIKSMAAIHDELLLEIGQTEKIKIEMELEDGSKEDVSATDITWTSSDEAVATVEEGTVEAVEDGTATITAEYLGREVAISVEVAADIPVDFSPENRRLESVIRSELDKPSGTIYRSDMAEITHLEANDARVENLDEIRHCINLESLSLIGNRITDLDGLSNLTNLERLELGHNQISDIGPLSNLENLRWLSLNDNRIFDLEPLNELTDLSWLSLARNEVNDLSSLKELSRLESLDLSENEISSLNIRWEMPDLKVLLVRDNEVDDLSPLEELNNLSAVNASGNRITDISMMLEFPRLTWLAIYHNDISSEEESRMQNDIWKLEDRGVYVQID